MGKRKPYGPAGFAVLATILLVLAVIASFRPIDPEHELIARSTVRAVAGAWVAEGYPDYRWLADNSVVFCRSTDDGVMVTTMEPSGRTRSRRYVLREPVNAMDHPLSARVCPDGRRLIVTDLVPSGQPQKVIVVDLRDGSHRDLKSPFNPFGCFWLSDSHRWMMVGPSKNDMKVEIHSVDGPDVGNASISGGSGPAYVLQSIGLTPAGHLFRLGGSITRPDIEEYDTIHGSRLPTEVFCSRRRVTLPGGYIVREAALSPLGDRIAYVLDRQTVPFGVRIQQLFRLQGQQCRHEVGLWTSRADGSGLHEVGTFALGPGTRNPLASFPFAIHWTADGRGLCFFRDGVLFATPAF